MALPVATARMAQPSLNFFRMFCAFPEQSMKHNSDSTPQSDQSSLFLDSGWHDQWMARAVRDVECLLPLASVLPTAQAEASIVSGGTVAYSHPAGCAGDGAGARHAVAAGLEQLRDACCRPRWTVPIADLKEVLGTDSAVASAGSGLRLLTCHSGHSCIT